MPTKNLLLTTVRGQAASRAVIAGGSRISTVADAQYLLQMEDERTVRDNIIVKRVGRDLQVFVDGVDEPNLTLENFYGEGVHAQLGNVDADGQIHAYALTNGPGSDGHPLLVDGESAALFLGGPALGVLPEISAPADHAAALPLWPYLLGAAAIGTAGVAYHRHMQDSDHDSAPAAADTTPPPLPTDWHADRSGIGGKAEAGCTVVIYYNGSKLTEVPVDDHGDWQVTLEDFPVAGPHTYSFTIEVIDKAGNSSGQTKPIEYIVPPWSGKAEIVQVIDHLGSVQGEIQPNGLTNDPRPQLMGRCSTGTVFVTIFDGATVLGTVRPHSDGTWTFTPPIDLGEGPHSLTTQAFGGVSGSGEPSVAWNFTLDTTPPALPTDWHADRSGIGGKAEAGCTVVIYYNGSKLTEVPVDDHGDWQVTLEDFPVAGPHTYSFTIEVIDKAGISSGQTKPIEYIVPPWSGKAEIVQVIDHLGSVQGEIEPNGLTNDPRPQLVGLCSTGTVFVTIYDGATVLGTVRPHSDGTWTFTPPIDLGEGPHSLTTTAFGGVSGSGEPSPAWTFTVDTTPPALATDWFVDNESGKGEAEAGSTVVAYHNGEKLTEVSVGDDGKWHYTLENPQPLSFGSHSFTVEVIDKAGNSSGLSTPIDLCIIPPATGREDNSAHSAIATGSNASSWDNGAINVSTLVPELAGNVTITAERTESANTQGDAGASFSRTLPASVALEDLLADSAHSLFPMGSNRSVGDHQDWSVRADAAYPSTVGTDLNALLLQVNASLV